MPYDIHTLSLKAGLRIQTEQLLRWKLRLNPQCYAALRDYAEKQNELLLARPEAEISGYDVTRGTDLDMLVVNWQPGPTCPADEIHERSWLLCFKHFDRLSRKAQRQLADRAVSELGFSGADEIGSSDRNQLLFGLWRGFGRDWDHALEALVKY